jgi:O-antigen/teichoic acid export membrane protein
MNLEIAKSVARSTTVQIAQQIATWASSFVLMLFLPRYLGPEDYGRLYLAGSLVGIFLIFVDYEGRLGIGKRVSRSPESTAQIVANSIGFRFVFWIITFISLIVFSYIAGYPSAVKILIIVFGLEMLWISARTVLLGVFLGHEVMQYSSISSIVERVFISIVSVTALLLGVKSFGLAIIMVSGTLLSFVLCVIFVKRIIPKLPKFDFKASLVLIKEGIPFLLYTVFGVIYYRVDTVMLSLMAPPAVVGWYGASYKFFDMLAFMPSIFSITILPILSKLWGKADDIMERTTQKSLGIIIIVGIPISIGVFSFSYEIIKMFYGLQGYAPTILNLKIFAVGLLLLYIDMILGTAIFAINKQRNWAVVAFIAVIVNISLNYLMIPYTQVHYGNGGIGSAIATIITEFFVMCSALVILPRSFFGGSLNTIIVKSLISAAVMAASLWLMALMDIFWVIQIVISAILYLSVILVLKVFTPAELTFIRSSLAPGNIKNAFILKKKEDA